MKPLLAPIFILALSASASSPSSFTGIWSYGTPETGSGELRLLEKNGHIRFQLNCNRGGPSYNSGFIEGEFKVLDGIGIYKSDKFGPCELTFRFKRNQVEISQSGKDTDCGFGANVYAQGVYIRVSKARPKFERPGK